MDSGVKVIQQVHTTRWDKPFTAMVPAVANPVAYSPTVAGRPGTNRFLKAVVNQSEKGDSKMSKVMIPEAVTDIFEIPVNMIVADAKMNTRKTVTNIPELAKTINYEGQQTPVLVAKRKDGKFDLIYGFRRFYAISWPKEDGGLGWETIKARVTEEMPTEERLMTNLVENLAREDLNSFDTAVACKHLEDTTKGSKNEMSGAKIANRVGKSASYINNLLKAMRNLPPNITLRWKEEQSADWDEKYPGTKRILTTDNLNRLSKDSLTDEERQKEFRRLKGEDVDGNGGGGGGAGAGAGGVKRASKAALEKALEAAQKLNKKKTSEQLKATIAALKFALGEATGIKGVWEPEEDEDEEESN
jgi:ParB/RepB/Spo0J family partition protein